jgi:hypothetical protein
MLDRKRLDVFYRELQTPSRTEANRPTPKQKNWCEQNGIVLAGEVTNEVLSRFPEHLFFQRKMDGQQLSVSSQYSRLGVGSFPFSGTTPATIHAIANTGATLRFGQERSKVKNGLNCRALSCPAL